MEPVNLESGAREKETLTAQDQLLPSIEQTQELEETGPFPFPQTPLQGWGGGSPPLASGRGKYLRRERGVSQQVLTLAKICMVLSRSYPLPLTS